MGFKSKVVSRDKISGFFVPVDIPDGEYGTDDINKRVAAQQEAINEGATADWAKPGDDSPALGNARSQLRKSLERYSSDDDGSR